VSFSFFLLGFLVLPDLLWWAWADRRARGTPWARLLIALFAAPMLAQVLWILLAPETARRAHHWLPMTWLAAAYLWHLLILPLTLLALLLGRGARLCGAPDLSRRRFLALGSALAPPALAGLGAFAGLRTLDDLRVRRLDLPIPGLPPALDGLVIAHVSDLHYGKFTRAPALAHLRETLAGFHADLTLFTGDLIDLTLADLPPAIDFLKSLDPGAGLFLCEGNHDRIHDGAEFAKRVKGAGIALLLDEEAKVEVRGTEVQLLGVAWQGREEARREATLRAVGRRDPAAFPILLAHHPHCFDHAPGIPLVLSGHTHGGQLMLNERLGAGAVLYRYWSGPYRDGDRTLVVSNGAGNWFPLRWHAPAEVAHLTLRAAPPA